MTLERLKTKAAEIGYQIGSEEKQYLSVFDPHYGKTSEYEVAIIHRVSKGDEDGFDFVGFDHSRIIAIQAIKQDDGNFELTFDNTRQYGSRVGDMVEGWSFDDGTFNVLGYRSTGRYKEAV